MHVLKNKPKMNYTEQLTQLFRTLYGDNHDNLLDGFLNELLAARESIRHRPLPELWYKDAVIYSLYVDAFDTDFAGLTRKLDYLRKLGVDCLWLLPILDSPMKDAGFDIRDYRSIRRELFSLPPDAPASETHRLFGEFLDRAHEHGIRVIFDIAMNHTSIEHPWFIESRKGPGNPYRDYYIWNHNSERYKEARLLFKGLCPSNWEYDNGAYFFHRFYEFQPDLNYRNPAVLLEISRILVFWLQKGVDGFRADAIPFIWKEDGTSCENLPMAHVIVKFFRALIEYLRPGTLLLAEANQPPLDVVEYFGRGDECHAGYHFPLMPQVFLAMAQGSALPVQKVLHPDITPPIPEACQWVTFLRLHDELTLEMVTPEERDLINAAYRHDIRWIFREGEGISARLSELFRFRPEKVLQAFSIMLTLPGTPVIYYGDEFGRANDEGHFAEMYAHTGHPDSRFYVRGPVDWEKTGATLAMEGSFGKTIFDGLRRMLACRRPHLAFGRGSLQWTVGLPDGLLAFVRKAGSDQILVIHNLTAKAHTIPWPADCRQATELLSGQSLPACEPIVIQPFANLWIKTN